ncbi:MAG: molybdopterin-binding protein, partial [Acidobacteriota bacterium]
MNTQTDDRTAAALMIGNELLTGKIQDTNVAVLAKEFFSLGVSLRRVVVCPDEIDVIAGDVNALRKAHDWVVTSGGVGPTHDD